MYHVSLKRLSDEILYPRVPNNYFTKNGFEDSTIPRVCVSETIEGALAALNQNIKNKEIYVYKVKSIEGLNILTNKEILGKVPDAYLTKEYWILDEVKVVFYKKLLVIDSCDVVMYNYGNDNGNLIAEFCNWTYEELID